MSTAQFPVNLSINMSSPQRGYVGEASVHDASAIRHHSEALGNVFLYAVHSRKAPGQLGVLAKSNQTQALAACRAMMASKTPCSQFPNSVATKFLERRDWARHPEMVELFHEYVAAGMIDLDGLMPYGDAANVPGGDKNNMALPLELCVLLVNPDGLQVFLDAGADRTKVPSRDWSVTSNTRKLDGGGSPGDICEFITAKVPDPAMGPLMEAIVVEVTLNKRIGASVIPSTPTRQLRRSANSGSTHALPLQNDVAPFSISMKSNPCHRPRIQ